MAKSDSNRDAIGIVTFPSVTQPVISTVGWSKHDWAKFYVSLGFSVIPVISGGKKPAVPWKEFQTRIATVEERDAWFDVCNYNIGIVTGKISGIVVVDADTPEAVVFAEGHGLANAPCVRTSKGAHYYCQYVEGTRNFQKRADLPGIDLRAEGGYVVAPPSVHETGKIYSWDGKHNLFTSSLAVIPEWVLPQPEEAVSKSTGTMVHSKPVKSVATNNVERDFPPADFEKIVKECGFIGYCTREPASLTEAEWYAVITIVVRCQNGVQYVHQISEPYPGYSRSETQKKIVHSLQTSKPRTCKDIEQNINGAHCKRCPHRGKIKSPISLGHVPEHVRAIKEAIDLLNREYVQLRAGEKTILVENLDANNQVESIEYISKRNLQDYFKSDKIRVPVKGEDKFKDYSFADLWLNSPCRRRLRGVEFNPKMSALDIYNLYRGMAVSAVKGDWSLFRHHIKYIICNGDELLFFYVLAWMARIVQDPGGERPGIAIVLKGSQGTGKGIFATIFGRLFGGHFVHIMQKEHLLGQFNNLLKEAMVVFWDEASLINDPKSEAVMKSLITEATRSSEEKYQPATITSNHVNLIMASNNDWVVPASADERRFLVVNVSNKRRQDHQYFAAITQQMDAGGLEAMLYDLMQIDISGINLRQMPKTEGLLNQKLNSLGTVEKYWYELLHSGSLLHGKDAAVGSFSWGDFIPTKVLHEDYEKCMTGVSRNNAVDRSLFAKTLRQICPNANPCQRSCFSHSKAKGYVIPDLEICRNDFSSYLNAEIEWDID